jgi:5'-deoxynucleotidase YfbR-like HD superfamily hydrolase
VLLHDAPEYVIGDIISPFKAVIGDAYKAIETNLLAAIHLHFGLPPQASAACRQLTKKADRQAAFLEATHLAGFSETEAVKYFGRPDPLPGGLLALLEPLPIAEAQQRYQRRVEDLQAGPRP